MARDRSSSVMQTLQKDHCDFFAVKSACPDPIGIPTIVGFQISDPNHRKDVKEAFTAYLSRFTHLSRNPIYRRSENGWIVKVRFTDTSIANRMKANHSFPVISIVKNGSKEIEKCEIFRANPTILKEQAQRDRLLARVIEGDITIFNSEIEVGKIYSVKTDEVSVYYTANETGTLFVLFRRRQIRQAGKIIQDHDPFWSYYFIENDEMSEIDILKNVDANDRGAQITLTRLVGGTFSNVDREKMYQRAITNFAKPLNPTNPIPSKVKESADLSKLGKNCIPDQLQAFEFARKIGENSNNPEDRKFWENVTIDKTLRAKYMERLSGGNGTGFRRKKQKPQIIKLADLILDRPDIITRN